MIIQLHFPLFLLCAQGRGLDGDGQTVYKDTETHLKRGCQSVFARWFIGPIFISHTGLGMKIKCKEDACKDTRGRRPVKMLSLKMLR